jgi:proteasome accessory factor A
MRDLTLENPIRAIREVSHDMTGRRKVRLANGREMSALDIQREYLQGQDFTDRNGADATTERVLMMWEHGPRRDRDRQPGPDRPGIDWVTKYQLIERLPGQARPAAVLPRVAQLDLAYHDVHRGRGLYYLLQRGARSSGPP